MYRVFHLKRKPATHEPHHAQNDETFDNIEFLQPYPVVAADTLPEISTAVISAVSSLDEHLSQTGTFCVLCTSWCTVGFFGLPFHFYLFKNT
jgi:hypothetical protein